MSLIGWLTASVTDTTMALVEDGALLGPRQLDMGNSGLVLLFPIGGVSPLLGLEPVLFRERVHRLTVYTLFEDTSLPEALLSNCTS